MGTSCGAGRRGRARIADVIPRAGTANTYVQRVPNWKRGSTMQGAIRMFWLTRVDLINMRVKQEPSIVTRAASGDR